ncbi:MAG: single-stranded DNA-binding protein [Candidatus Omnitrophica bacterium]|nr:single-stranded DNA-binding protein [Candidatus Omnitrophota bacterium]
MASLNKVLLIGNLTRDPELRYIPSGTAVATFTVAVNRAYTLPSGEKKEEVCFVKIVVWGRRAEVCGEFLSKGSPVFIEGRLQSRSWEDQSGQKRSTTEVVANNVQFLGGKGKDVPVPQEPENQGEPIPDIDAGGPAASPGAKAPEEEVPF